MKCLKLDLKLRPCLARALKVSKKAKCHENRLRHLTVIVKKFHKMAVTLKLEGNFKILISYTLQGVVFVPSTSIPNSMTIGKGVWL